MRVAVIGAGVSGLAAAKCLMEAGAEPIVFEQDKEIGGIWRYDEALPDGGGPAYRGLHTNTSKQTTAFSDFPFPAHLPDFPPRAEMWRYLDNYADHFHVRERIRFGTQVGCVQPAGGGRWTVESRSEDAERVETFDAVVVSSGVFRDPMLPVVPGADTFTGTIMHSRAYTTPERFAGQTVLVVGSGSSATDVAVEVSRVARHVLVSVRGMASGGAGQRGTARARTLQAWLDRLIPRVARTRLARHAALVWARWVPRRRHDAPDAPFVLGKETFSPSPKLREPLASGAVTLRPGLAAIDGDSVIFTDGGTARVDTIVFGTGYALSFPFLDPSIFRPSMDGLDLYRLIFPPDHPTLAFTGMFRVSGPAPPVAEMQARWAARVLRGQVKLPAPPEMRAEIAARHAAIKRTGGNPFRLNAEAYQDMLAAEIGALPRLWRHASLWRALLAGPAVAAQYRLDGPNRWSGAAQAIKDAQGARGKPVSREEPAPVARAEQA